MASHPLRRALCLLLTIPALALPLAAARETPAQTLAKAQELIDANSPRQALPLLNDLLQREPGNARALLLRSTARFLADDLAGGKQDLDRALELDPALRQGWLNRAGLEVAAKRYDAALAAFGRAEKLDPRAPENDLNIGAVLLLQGKLQAANGRFESYMQKQAGIADASYLVASNYAAAGYAALAVAHLRRAIELDERSRLRARTDPNFAGLSNDPHYQELLATDAYRPPAGSHLASRTYDTAYDPADGALLSAVVEAMQLAGERFDPRVETTPEWALLWGDLRIKVSRGADGKGVVQASAPFERMPIADWQRRSAKLFQQIAVQLYNRQLARVKQKPAPPG
jgi:tetratricopeptide (TPR) repeat protein